MSLPTTKRGSNVNLVCPTGETVEACYKTTTLPDAGDYLLEAVIRRAADLGEDFNMIETTKKFRDNLIASQRDSGEIWDGKAPTGSQFKNLNRTLGNQAAQALITEDKTRLDMVIAINEQADIERGFAINGGIPALGDVKQLEQLLNAWFAENDMVCEKSSLYEVDDEGNILKDAQGKPIKVASETFKNKLMDESTGFTAFCQQKGLQTATYQQAYAAKVEKADKAEKVVEAVPTQEPTVTPKADSDEPTPSI